MSFLSKLAFWKKESPLDFDQVAQRDIGMTPTLSHDPAAGAPQDPYSSRGYMPNTAPSYQTPAQPPVNTRATPEASSRDIALLSSKLDTIKALLDNIDRRLSQLERSEQTREKQPRLW